MFEHDNRGAEFSSHKTDKGPIGHISSLKIGGEQFKENIMAKIPTDFEAVTVAGILNASGWKGGLRQSLYFDRPITSNKTLVDTFIMNSLDSTEVFFSFTIYQYDHDAKKYFISCKGEELKGNIFERNERLKIEFKDRNRNKYGSITAKEPQLYQQLYQRKKSKIFKSFRSATFCQK